LRFKPGLVDPDSLRVTSRTRSGSTPVTLAEFVATNPPSRTCFVCDAPEDIRRQLEANRYDVKTQVGATYRTMIAWLDTLGYSDVTRHKLERHWQHKHGELAR
jgi:hypothetical protein